MADHEVSRLRSTFGEDAALYDRCRPGYPTALFDDLRQLAGIGPGSTVLEIGCGTGQATVPLARLGCALTAVELSGSLAARARRNLAHLPNADVVVAAFEDWPLPAGAFDVVLSATAFHWIDPSVRVSKAAHALRADGSLAVISTHHIAGGTAPFFVDVQRCYEQFDPATPPGLRLSAAADIPAESSEFDQSGRFGPVDFRRYEWEASYSTAEYLDLLCTYSGHRALPGQAREGLLGCIRQLIDDRHGGRITKRYLTQLALTHRMPQSADA